MNDKLNSLIDWDELKAVMESREANPHSILGAHVTKEGILIKAYIPAAVSMELLIKKKAIPMETGEVEGVFAALLPGDKIPDYTFRVTYQSGEQQSFKDPYIYMPQITEKETKQFAAGICYDIYEKLGAHPMTVDGTKGIYFAVWAPNAVRVSIVGDFNAWDGRRLPMRKLWDSGIFELFVPGMSEEAIYKFEIKAQSSLVFLKADPYANAAELRPATASKITNLARYEWQDKEWLKNRKKAELKKSPLAIYELHLGSFKKTEAGEFYTYRELAPMITEYVKEMGYTHVELMPVMEHPLDRSLGYQVTGYYAPTSRYGSPLDFMYMIDCLHQAGIGVILDWVPAHFAKDDFGLAAFDGTCLYEHQDPRKGSQPKWGTALYNYGRPEVTNFLISNALFWVKKYHVDGIRVNAVDAMLYLDYAKKEGEWVPNIYGGSENLEAVEFIKHLNSIMKKQHPDVMMIAEETTAWPMLTETLENGGLGFDFKWNVEWTKDVLAYVAEDVAKRSGKYNDLTLSMLYAYSEDFILSFSHGDVLDGKGSMLQKMPGSRSEQIADLRTLYAYTMMHPGKKLLFMGQEYAEEQEWKEDKGLNWALLENEEHQKMQQLVKSLNRLYQSQPALYQMDFEAEGFTWINNMAAEKNLLVFTRNTKKKEETLLVIVNFSADLYEKYQVGVPYPGKYKEIFNSNALEFGGDGSGNPRVKQSKKEECDEREESISVLVPPRSVLVFSYAKVAPKAKTNKEAKDAKAGIKKEEKAAEKEPVKKTAPKKAEKPKKSLKEGIVETIDEVAKTAKKVISRKL